MADETTAPAEEKDENKTTCPCCGKTTLIRPVKVDGKIVDDYLACIMTGVPFSHQFNLFDGKLQISAGVIGREEGIKLYSLVFMLDPFAEKSNAIRDFIGILNMYINIKQVIVKTSEKDDPNVYFPAKHIMESCTKLLDKWEHEDLHDEEKKTEFIKDVQQEYDMLSSAEVLSATPVPILARLIGDFRTLESILLETGFDENFWKGIKLA